MPPPPVPPPPVPPPLPAAAGAPPPASPAARASGGARAVRSSPQRSAELAGGRDRRDALLAELVILVLERDHDLRVCLVGCASLGNVWVVPKARDAAITRSTLPGRTGSLTNGWLPNVLQALIDGLAGGQCVGRGADGAGRPPVPPRAAGASRCRQTRPR